MEGGVGFPEALDVGTDHDGAIRVVWENGPRFLELVAPCEDDAAAYFYYSEGDQFGLQKRSYRGYGQATIQLALRRSLDLSSKFWPKTQSFAVCELKMCTLTAA